jgi:hypothetical protein
MRKDIKDIKEMVEKIEQQMSIFAQLLQCLTHSLNNHLNESKGI